MNKLTKQIIFISITLLISAKAVKADNLIHNETGKYGQAQDIIVYTSSEQNGVKLAPWEAKSFKVNGDYDMVAWQIGNAIYKTFSIKKPKDTYIYSDGKYLTWTWTGFLNAPTENKNLVAQKYNQTDLGKVRWVLTGGTIG